MTFTDAEMRQEAERLACPFCKRPDVAAAGEPGARYLVCEWCGARGPQAGDLRDATELWRHALAAPSTGAGDAVREAEVERLRAELEDVRLTAIAGMGIHAANQAHLWGLPSGHLHAHFYDQLAKLGARMDSFTRVDDPSPAALATDATEGAKPAP